MQYLFTNPAFCIVICECFECHCFLTDIRKLRRISVPRICLAAQSTGLNRTAVVNLCVPLSLLFIRHRHSRLSAYRLKLSICVRNGLAHLIHEGILCASIA